LFAGDVSKICILGKERLLLVNDANRFSYLRSFRNWLLLSTSTLDDFVGVLNYKSANASLDSMDICILEAVRHHPGTLTVEGNEKFLCDNIMEVCPVHVNGTVMNFLQEVMMMYSKIVKKMRSCSIVIKGISQPLILTHAWFRFLPVAGTAQPVHTKEYHMVITLWA
jgi:hypothetical protein